MIGIEMVRSARADVAQLQSALMAVEAGLETVEVAAEAVDAARRWSRRVLGILFAIGVVGLVVGVATAAVRSRRGKESNRRHPDRRPTTGGQTLRWFGYWLVSDMRTP